jgi:ankyrin repeat protein
VEGCSALILAVEKGRHGLEMAKALLKAGADPNILTLNQKSALKIACEAQDVMLVNTLLDHHVLRMMSAFSLLVDEAFNKVQGRLLEEERKLEEAQKKVEKEEEWKILSSVSTRNNKTMSEAWVEYREKKTHKAFYYNTVTRKSTFDKPADFRPDRTRLVKDVIYGMSFYH